MTGRLSTLWTRLDLKIIYWRQHAPFGMPRHYFDRYFYACFVRAVLKGHGERTADFFTIMDTASGLLHMSWANARPRGPVPNPAEDNRPKNRRTKGRKAIFYAGQEAKPKAKDQAKDQAKRGKQPES